MTFGKDHRTYDLSLAILHEEIEHEAWFSEFLGHGPSAHYGQEGRPNSRYVGEFLNAGQIAAKQHRAWLEAGLPALAPKQLDACGGSETLASYSLLPAHAMTLCNLVWTRLKKAEANEF